MAEPRTVREMCIRDRCVEESVLSSLLHAETVTGYDGRTVQCLSDLLKK